MLFRSLAITIENALAEAGLRADQIDLIIPTGTGIPQDDRAEAAAMERVFGAALERIDVWAIKGMTSHTGAAAGALDVAAAVKAIEQGNVGPSVNFAKAAAGCRLKLTRTVVERPIRNAVCCGYSFGGQTAAVIVKKYEA